MDSRPSARHTIGITNGIATGTATKISYSLSLEWPVDVPHRFPRTQAPAQTNLASPVRFHDMHHTNATLMLGQPVHPKVVSEGRGHRQVATTLNTHSQVLPGLGREAGERLGATLHFACGSDDSNRSPGQARLAPEESDGPCVLTTVHADPRSVPRRELVDHCTNSVVLAVDDAELDWVSAEQTAGSEDGGDGEELAVPS